LTVIVHAKPLVGADSDARDWRSQRQVLSPMACKAFQTGLGRPVARFDLIESASLLDVLTRQRLALLGGAKAGELGALFLAADHAVQRAIEICFHALPI
jgi:hypothetical protein